MKSMVQSTAQALTKETDRPFLGSLVKVFQFASLSEGAELAKLIWLVKLRWLATAMFFTLAILGLVAGYLSRSTVSQALGIVGVLLVFNLITHSSTVVPKKSVGPLVICFQMTFDLLALTLFLYLTGGFANPMVPLFLLNAALGGILIAGRYAWPFVLLVHILIAFLQFDFFVVSGWSSQWTSMGAAVIFHVITFSAWFVMRSLGQYLEEQQRLQMNARLTSEKQDRLRAVGALAAGFSHEFASPLNAARLRIARLLRNQSSEDLEEAMAAIESCEQVIRQMNSSQMDARDYEFKLVDLQELVGSVVEAWRVNHPDASVKLSLSAIEKVQVPPVNLAQVLLNLLDNAHEAATNSSLQVSLSQDSEKVLLSVQDQGAGFSQDILQRLGEPFVTDKPEGTGLGLYVTQLFVQSLGGDLLISNKAEGGASVLLQWPLIRGNL